MKAKNFILVALSLIALAFVCPSIALAQDSALPISAETQDSILGFLTGLAAKYPLVTTLLAAVGFARVWVKPVCSILHSIVDLTPSKTDDGWWATAQDFFTNNAVGKALAFLVDWLGSVKLVPPAKPNP